ncbi:MAG TPA: M18 family aminopeptidase [Dermatophilaceae bacterium]|nr:M18 family aminopeptidase [Dermatophilaceae bacterium]
MPDDAALDLCAFVDAAPSAFHACAEAARRLGGGGFVELAEHAAWPTAPGGYFLRRGGSLLAWRHADVAPATGFRVLAAHTDSPNLRVKPQPDLARSGWQQLAVEVYGAPLWNSWLDRDLGLSGQVAVRTPTGVETRLVRVDDPVLRVPQLAIHLDRDSNTSLALNPQQHLTPVWGVGTSPRSFRSWLGELVESSDVLAWTLMTHDLTASRLIGAARDLVAAPRLDNLATCHAGVSALLAAAPPRLTPVLALFDHEEVGSESDRGAQSTLLTSTLERVVLCRGGARDDLFRALAATVVASGDMAHATHPNYPERHDPQHQVAVNGGPVLKTNAKLRYATDPTGAATFRLACDQAGVPLQQFVARNDMPCGSTVGPMTAARTGATTVDFGAPMLSMHSARELCGAKDPAMYAAALTAFLDPA